MDFLNSYSSTEKMADIKRKIENLQDQLKFEKLKYFLLVLVLLLICTIIAKVSYDLGKSSYTKQINYVQKYCDVDITVRKFTEKSTGNIGVEALCSHESN